MDDYDPFHCASHRYDADEDVRLADFQIPRARVDVLVVEAPLAPLGAISKNPLERKRQTIWANERRNDQIARVAQAFADRQLDPLWQCGLLLNETQFPAKAHGWVAVLVESPEHGQAIAERLPGWMFMHAAP